MTILTTTEKSEFLSIESWCLVRLKLFGKLFDKKLFPAISGKSGALKGTNLGSCLSCRSCSEKGLSLHFAHGFWICILPE